jgi:hypothetical protein
MRLTRPSLQRADQVVAVSVFSFSGMLANNRDGVLAIVSAHRSGFAGNQDQRLFFFVAMLFFLLAGSRHGCNIVGRDFSDLWVEFENTPYI